MAPPKGHPKWGGRVKGTPNRFPRKPGDAVQIGKQYTAEAMALWIELMRGEDKDLAFRASRAIVERGNGGVPMPVRLGDPEGNPLDFGAMTEAQLDSIILRLQQYLASQGEDASGGSADAQTEGPVH